MKNHKWTAAEIPDQTGKMVVVTGANSGIGYQAAVELARKGAHVVMGVRSRVKGDEALARLKVLVPAAKAEVAMLDVSSLASVRAFAAGFARPLDVLINNAGVMAIPTRTLTVDGFEMQMGTNHFGHFALTGLLLPRLKETGSPRVVTVSSLAHQRGKIEFDNLQAERKYVPWEQYGATKLANLLFALELDRRVRKAGLQMRSVPVHPGIAKTGIFSAAGNDLKSRVVQALGPVLMQPDAMGALPTLYAATAPEAQGGQYIGPDGFMAMRGWPAVEEPRPQAKDEAVAAKLWEVSEALTGVRYSV